MKKVSDKIMAPYVVPLPLTGRGLCAIIVEQTMETLSARAIPGAGSFVSNFNQ